MLTKSNVIDEIALLFVDVADTPEGIDVDGYCLLRPVGDRWQVDVQAEVGTLQREKVGHWHGQVLVTMDRVREFAEDVRAVTWNR